jgi:phenylacetate-coenzyme A ligase PaaK-like adenylate-forming protein
MAGAVRVFPDGWNQETAAFAPAAVAGTFEQIQALGQSQAASLTHAVIVLARAGGRRLNERDRTSLWQAFRLPVFEQIIGESGALLAAECEAHDGLHIESQHLPLEQEAVDLSPCACGSKKPRIGVTRGAELERRVAAYAR